MLTIGYKSGRVGYDLLTKEWLFFDFWPEMREDRTWREGFASLREPHPFPLATGGLAKRCGADLSLFPVR